jgi:hypothetical protein
LEIISKKFLSKFGSKVSIMVNGGGIGLTEKELEIFYGELQQYMSKIARGNYGQRQHEKLNRLSRWYAVAIQKVDAQQEPMQSAPEI